MSKRRRTLNKMSSYRPSYRRNVWPDREAEKREAARKAEEDAAAQAAAEAKASAKAKLAALGLTPEEIAAL